MRLSHFVQRSARSLRRWIRGRDTRLWHGLNGRRRFRPRVESLEDRTVLTTVTNLDDAGAGSLRDAIAITAAGDTVDFADGLTGTITLTDLSGPLMIDKAPHD